MVAKRGCGAARSVRLHIVGTAGDSVAGTTSSAGNGSWRVDATTPAGAFTVYADVSRKRTKKADCRPAISSQAHMPDAAPALNVTTPLEGELTGPNGQIVYSSSEPVSVACTLDGTPLPGCGGYSSLPQGDHQLVASATDSAGQSSSVTRTFQVDASGPTITVISPEDSQITGSTPSFVFTADDPGGPVTTECEVDGQAFACVPGTAGTFGPLPTGDYTLTVSASDRFGNLGAATVDFTVDGTAPAVAITNPLEGTTVGSPVTVTFSATDTSVPLMTPRCEFDGVFIQCLSGQAHALASGPHLLTVYVTDAVGNTGSDTVSFAVS